MDVEVDVAGDVEIEIAVQVVIGEGGARAPAVEGQGFGGGPEYRPIRTEVPVEAGALQMGDHEVGIAVVVHVPRRGPHAPAFADIGGQGGLGKGAVPPVQVEGVPGGGIVLLQSAPVDQVEVEPAVPVGVEQGAAAAFRLDDVVLDPAPGPVPEADPRLVGDVGEAGAGAGRPCLLQRRAGRPGAAGETGCRHGQDPAHPGRHEGQAVTHRPATGDGRPCSAGRPATPSSG